MRSPEKHEILEEGQCLRRKEKSVFGCFDFEY